MQSEIHSLRAKPVIIEGMKWTGKNFHDIYEFTRGNSRMDNNKLIVETREGSNRVACDTNYWVLRGVSGEYYPVSDGSVERKYDKVDPNVKLYTTLAINDDGSISITTADGRKFTADAESLVSEEVRELLEDIIDEH